MPDGQFAVCHKSGPPASEMVAVRLRDLPPPAWDMQFTLTCLQGLVNRESPRLYLAQDRFDELWLQWLVERGDVDRILWLSPQQALERFAGMASGLVIIDPAIPASINVATMLAGIRGWLAATPAFAIAQQLGQRFSSASQGVIDLSDMGWESDVQAYECLYDRYYDDLSHEMCAICDPYDLPLRDYMVEFKVPLLWVKKEDPGGVEEALVEDILMRLPPNIPCLGWPYAPCSADEGLGEHRGVILVNEHAKFELCSGYETVSRAVSNLSVHSGTSMSPGAAVAQAHRQEPPPPLEDKVYLALIRTDGDGANFHRECYRSLWEDLSHGRFPIAWQQGPMLYDLMPDILDWYYQHATPNDSFVNALTGIGYIHEENYAYRYPPEQRASIWENYLRLSQAYREKLGFSCLTTYHEMSRERLASFCRIGFEGLFANYNRSFITSLHNQVEEVEGIPVFRACNTSDARVPNVAGLVSEIRRWAPRQRPAFLYVSLTNWFTRMEYAEAALAQLGPGYVPVTPEQLLALYTQWRAQLT